MISINKELDGKNFIKWFFPFFILLASGFLFSANPDYSKAVIEEYFDADKAAISVTMKNIVFQYGLQTITTDNIIIAGKENDQKITRKLVQVLQEDIDFFQKKIGKYPEFDLEVIISPDIDFYKQVTIGRGEIIEFSDAFFLKNRNLIFVKPLSKQNFRELSTILLHEYIHAFVNHYFKDAPLWFHEGMAVYFSKNDINTSGFIFIRDYLNGDVMKLEEMKTAYPESRSRWDYFYAISAHAVKHLYQNNRESFYKLWDLGEEDILFERAFVQSFYFTTVYYSAVLPNYLKGVFIRELLSSFPVAIWGFLSAVLIVGVIIRRFRNKKSEDSVYSTEISTDVENGSAESNDNI
ncbi:MAG: hypothetical protein PHR06_01395 [Candidatus Cloacimonetes bacterium]|nr:hypothetical protein [Candidatus Cloacimonadota bacterium]